jgi:hypothetical protein
MIICLECGKDLSDGHTHISKAVGKDIKSGRTINLWGCGCEAMDMACRYHVPNWSYLYCKAHGLEGMK